MAPTAMAPSGTPTSSDFDGDDFSNNLFSDLAPLLTLFGEQVTKQFLSLSMGWADHILLAMGPLGIITIVVSAIRVSGPNNLKAIVGRARESLTTAEMELLSSTSHDVCEMWDGNQIVRAIGQPKDMRELIILENINEHNQQASGDFHALDFETAVRRGHLAPVGYLRYKEIDKVLKKLMGQAPNITLNVSGSTLSKFELWIWAAIGLAIQMAALIVPGLAIYLWKWQKDEDNIVTYGYPCFLSGSLAIIVGVLGCSYVIEQRTEEVIFQPKSHERGSIRCILRVQDACTVGDQHFQSYAIMSEPSDFTLRTSRFKSGHGGHWSSIAAASTFVVITGYIIQFIGLRALHWSATIIQLGVTLVMTCCRAWVRRGLASQPTCVPLEETRKAECLTLLIVGGEYNERTQQKPSQPDDHRVRGWELQKLNSSLVWQPTSRPEIVTFHCETNNAVMLYQQYCKLLEQPLGHCKWSSRLCMAVNSVMKYITTTEDVSIKQDGAIRRGSPLYWRVNTIHERPSAKDTNPKRLGHVVAGVTLGSKNEEQLRDWMVNPIEVQSILELWVFSLTNRINCQRACLVPTGIITSDRHEAQDEYSHLHYHVLGTRNEDETWSDWIDGYDLISEMRWAELMNLTEQRPQELPTSNANETSEPLWISERVYPMRQICALELFSLFLSAIFSELSGIKGHVQKPEPFYSNQPFWGHTVVEALSSCILKANLVDTPFEATEFVVPALFQYNLL